MANGIPTFALTISDDPTAMERDSYRLFGYCIEATRGPTLKPTFVSSNAEAKRVFGVDFAPHFAQNPIGVLITRVQYAGMSKDSLNYTVEKTEEEDEDPVALTISKKYVGKSEDVIVHITQDTEFSGYRLTIKLPEVNMQKIFKGVKDLATIVKRINTNFGDYLEAKLMLSADDTRGTASNIVEVTPSNTKGSPAMGTLTGGSNGKIGTNDIDAGKEIPDGRYDTAASNIQTAFASAHEEAYRKAFIKMEEEDLLGVSVLTKSSIAHQLCIQHMENMNEYEVNQIRFAITANTDCYTKTNDTIIYTDEQLIDLASKMTEYDNEYLLCIGQGLYFREDLSHEVQLLEPYQCVQFYTGLRSSLGYNRAIFGGETAKVLQGVTDITPLKTDISSIDLKETLVMLNESGVMLFKKEYGDVTFIEGVTTSHSDVLSYESIMSIVAYVTKRLINVCRPYQGQNLTEDLKSSLQVALSNELQSIQQTDKTLIALEEFNIPPYDVKVSSAALVRRTENGELMRESKVIIRCRIVPVGALRDIDLGVIVL